MPQTIPKPVRKDVPRVISKLVPEGTPKIISKIVPRSTPTIISNVAPRNLWTREWRLHGGSGSLEYMRVPNDGPGSNVFRIEKGDEVNGRQSYVVKFHDGAMTDHWSLFQFFEKGKTKLDDPAAIRTRVSP